MNNWFDVDKAGLAKLAGIVLLIVGVPMLVVTSASGSR